MRSRHLFRAARELHRILKDGGRRRSASNVLTYGIKAVVERESTLDQKGGGMLVSLARRMMRERLADPSFGANAAAAACHVSRRLLDMRFGEILGRTFHDELDRARLEEARRRLIETSSTVTNIAFACGYATDAAFRNAFKAAFGTTPTALRAENGNTASMAR